jgi:hypothetical protein
MATLVLTAVGTALGGPIGGAVGAALGQAVDRATWARPAAREGPRLNGLAVQTSTYGTAIPKVFGTLRVAGCVIWSTDLIESRDRVGGGKGQPSVTTYSYAASFAVALSARAVRRVGRIWADGKLLRGAAGDWKSALGRFRLHTGGEDQAADPLIASAVRDAPAHRGLAYAVFEELQLADFGNRIPSLTFEVVADEAPVPIGGIARAIGGAAMAGEGPATTVAGFAASGDSVAGALEALGDAAGAWFVPRGGRMAMCDAVAAAWAVPNDAAVMRTRRPAESVPAALSLTYHDPARDWQVGSQQARRPGAGWREEAVALPAALPAAQARGVADAMLLAREAARERRRVTTDLAALHLAPGDAVLPAGEARAWRVASATLEGADVTLDIVPLPAAAVPRGADAGAPVTAPDVALGRTLLMAAELPPLGDVLPGAPQVTLLAGGTAAGWRGAALMVSRDEGATWAPAGGTAAPAVMGTLATALGEGPETLVQAAATELVLAHDGMTLAAIDAAALDRGGNLLLVGAELMQFRDAVQLAPRRWRVSTLLRGRRGTAVAAHPAGAAVALVEAQAALVLPASHIGERLRVVARGVGDGETGVETALTVSGASLAPPAPVALRVEERADGSAVVRWTRRSRLGWTWRDGGDAPLVEEREAYRVELSGVAGVRTVETDAPSLIVEAAARAQGALTVSVRQLGTLAASGPATIII